MPRYLRAVAIVLALVTTAAACGDDDTDDAAPTTEAGDTGDDAGDGPSPGGDVTIEGFAFEPASFEAAAGETITFVNADGVTHTVTAGTPEETLDTFDESLDGGATAEISLDVPGTYEYFCAIHTDMTGEIVVS